MSHFMTTIKKRKKLFFNYGVNESVRDQLRLHHYCYFDTFGFVWRLHLEDDKKLFNLGRHCF